MVAPMRSRALQRLPGFASSELALFLSSAAVFFLRGGCRGATLGWFYRLRLPALLRFMRRAGKFGIAARHLLFIIKALQGAALHLIAKDAFDTADHIPVFAGHEGEGIAGLCGTSCAAYPVRVGISGVGHVVVDDVGDA